MTIKVPGSQVHPAAGLIATDDALLNLNRTDFLLAMYKATWDNVGRHIQIVWQSVVALLTTVGILSASYLSASARFNKDVATILILLAAAWSVAHSLDAAGWFNRNLLIIGNIERQFLFARDEREIHFYFSRHRKAMPIEQFLVQILFASCLGILAIAIHFFARVVPGFHSSLQLFEWQRATPYVVFGALTIALCKFARRLSRQYYDLVEKSPGCQAKVVQTV